MINLASKKNGRRIAELETALRRCADKLKIEYDLQQPDADATECWAEAEAAWNLLRPKDA